MNGTDLRGRAERDRRKGSGTGRCLALLLLSGLGLAGIGLAGVALAGVALATASSPVAAAEGATPPGREAAARAATARPQRIVSLNLCADELVLRLVPKGRILSVTSLAGDPASSSVTALAADVPTNRGLAEEVIPLGPDLVIAGAFTTRATVALLERFGIPVLDLSVPRSLEEGYAQIRQVAARLGEAEKGEAMVAALRAVIPAAPPQGSAPRAVVVRPNGFTAGRGTLADDLMRRAGLDNVAARLSPDRLGQLSLEEIVTARPQVLILDTDPGTPPSLAGAILRHPALTEAVAHARTVALPTRLWSCPGPQLAEAYERLAAGARAAKAAGLTAQAASAADIFHQAASAADISHQAASAAGISHQAVPTVNISHQAASAAGISHQAAPAVDVPRRPTPAEDAAGHSTAEARPPDPPANPPDAINRAAPAATLPGPGNETDPAARASDAAPLRAAAASPTGPAAREAHDKGPAAPEIAAGRPAPIGPHP